MAIEIRELVIKASVDESGAGNKDAGQGSAVKNKEEIIADCVDRVMQILRDRDER